MFINNHKKQIRLLCRVLFALYIAGLVYFLFFAEMLDRTGIERSYRYNLIPFREIRRFIVYADLLGPMAVISNLFGNIVIFMPFGFLVPILGRKKRNFWFTSLLSFALSLAVECIQLVTRTGCFDVDDMILNTSGGILGYLMLKKTYHIIRKYIFLNTIGGMLGYLVYALVQRKRDRDADARRLKERS